MRKRWFAKREATLKGTGYDSMFEKNMHEGKLKDCIFHSSEHKVAYHIPHTYEPDFVYEKDGHTYLIETKGRFTDAVEAAKYKWIREALPSTVSIVFIWEKPTTRFPFARKRKDGTYMTQKEWADKESFLNFNQDEFDLSMISHT